MRRFVNIIIEREGAKEILKSAVIEQLRRYNIMYPKNNFAIPHKTITFAAR